MTILLIEDEQPVRELLTRRLQAHGYDTQEAENGRIGFEKAKQIKPGLIILDLNMPELDGIQVYQKLHQDPATEAIPVLFLTALSAGGTMTEQSLAIIASAKHRVQLQGKYAVMGKPYDAQQLLETIRRLTGQEKTTPAPGS